MRGTEVQCADLLTSQNCPVKLAGHSQWELEMEVPSAQVPPFRQGSGSQGEAEEGWEMSGYIRRLLRQPRGTFTVADVSHVFCSLEAYRPPCRCRHSMGGCW